MNETTRLEAINTMLSCIGESPVSSLSGQQTSDVVVSQQILNEVCKDLMSREWSWNTLRKQVLTPNASGVVSVPSNWVRVDHDRHDYMKRGTRLYDRDNETDVFSGPVSDLVAVVLLEWEEMPEPARRYAMIRAGRTLAARMVGSEKAVAFTERDEVQAFMVLREFEAEQADYNIFSNPDVSFNNRRWA
jgi:hypothetical protein